jgi:hypothetical protein
MCLTFDLLQVKIRYLNLEFIAALRIAILRKKILIPLGETTEPIQQFMNLFSVIIRMLAIFTFSLFKLKFQFLNVLKNLSLLVKLKVSSFSQFLFYHNFFFSSCYFAICVISIMYVTEFDALLFRH